MTPINITVRSQPVGPGPPPPPPPPGANEGRVKFYEYADPRMWNYVHGNGTITQWMRDHWQIVEAFHPSWDPYTDEIPSVDYIDVSAIYKTSSGTPQIPAYALKDANGNYVQFYGNTEFLADIGATGWWDTVIGWMGDAINAGFVGFKFDDVNLAPIPHSTPLLPINPRTSAVYTNAQWASDFADGLTRCRLAYPTATIIHNSVWWNQDLGNADILRAAQQCDIYEHERGAGSTAVSNGNVTTMMAYVDTLHSNGISSLWLASGSTGDTVARATFNLAVALLCSDGTDWAYNEQWEPDGWWTGNDTDLGAALGLRYLTAANTWRRDFSGGFVTANVSTYVGSIVTT